MCVSSESYSSIDDRLRLSSLIGILEKARLKLVPRVKCKKPLKNLYNFQLFLLLKASNR